MDMYIVNESSVIRGGLTYDYEDDEDDDDSDEDENAPAARQLELTVNQIVPKAVLKSDFNFVEKFNRVLDNNYVKSTDKPFDISTIWKPSVLITLPPNSKPNSDPSLIGTVRLLEDPTKSTLNFLQRLENILDPKNLSIRLEVPLNRDRDNNYLIVNTLKFDSSSPGIWKEDGVTLPSTILRIGVNPYGDYFSGRLTCILTLNQDGVNQVEDMYADIIMEGGASSEKTVKLNRKLLDGAICSDLVIVAGNREIKCHRAFLAAGSPVFRAMFESGWKESEKGARLEMEGEVGEESVRALLGYLYCGEIDKCVLKCCEVAVELLEMAWKYDVKELVGKVKGLLMLKPGSWYKGEVVGRLGEFVEKVELVELKEKIGKLNLN